MSAVVERIRCAERQAVNVPIDRVLGANGDVDILPIVQSKGYFDIDFRGGKLAFIAGKYIGHIPINARLVIDVQPKLPIVDLLRVLQIAEEAPGTLDFFDRLYKDVEGSDENLTNLIVRSLAKQLRTLDREGPHKTYSSVHTNSTFRPRINFTRSIQQHWSRGDYSHAAIEVFSYSLDNSFNRLIKYALWRSSVMWPVLDITQQRELWSYANLFERIPLDHSRGFIRDCRLALISNAFPSIKYFYRDILRTCLLIVEDQSINLDASEADTALVSAVINLEDVFEKYIRNGLAHNLSKMDPSLRIRDGNIQKGSLFFDSKFEIKPDIVVSRQTIPLVVADVKYKPKISEADRYQVISHSLSVGASIALLILPSDGLKVGLIRTGQIRNEEGIQVFEYHFDLTDKLIDQESKLAVCICELIGVPGA